MIEQDTEDLDCGCPHAVQLAALRDGGAAIVVLPISHLVKPDDLVFHRRGSDGAKLAFGKEEVSLRMEVLKPRFDVRLGERAIATLNRMIAGKFGASTPIELRCILRELPQAKHWRQLLTKERCARGACLVK